MSKKSGLIIIIVSIIAFCSIALAILFSLNVTGVFRFIETSITLKIPSFHKEYDGKIVKDVEYEITSGYLLNGDHIEITLKEDVKNVGEYNDIYEYKILNSNGADVTKYYKVNEEFNDLVIEPREIILKSNSQKFPYYEGETYSYPNYIISKGSLAENDEISNVFFDEFYEEGIYENFFTVSIINQNEEDVTNNYDIYYEYGYILVGNSSLSTGDGGEFPEKISVLSSNIESKPATLKSNKAYNYNEGKEVNLETIFKYRPKSSGSSFFVSEVKGDYTKKGWDNAKSYIPKNGINPQEFSSILLSSLSDRKFEGEIEYESIKARDSDLTSFYPILNKNQNSDTYSVISNLKDKTINVSGYSFDLINDYNLLTNLKFNDQKYIEAEKEYSSFVYKNYLSIPSSTKDKIEAIINKNNLKGNDLYSTLINIKDFFDSNFYYKYKDLKDVNSDDVLIDFLNNTREGKSDRFAGSAVLFLRSLGYPSRIANGYVVNGIIPNQTYLISGSNFTSWTEIYINGKGWFAVDFTSSKIKNENEIVPSIEVENDYNTYDIYIGSDDASKIYDGKTLKSSTSYNFKGSLKSNHQLIATNNSSLIDAGSIENKVDYLIVDENFNDVTNQYNIKEDFGTLTVIKRQITVETQNQKISYDGKIHYTEYTCKNLANGDKIYSYYEGDGLIEKGDYLSVITIDEIRNNNDKNVTNNYSINYLYGMIRIV